MSDREHRIQDRRGTRALLLVADGFERSDVVDVGRLLADNGFTVTVGGPDGSKNLKGRDGSEVIADLGVKQLDLDKYDLVVVPGGAAGDAIARDKNLANVVYSIVHKGRTVAVVGTAVRSLFTAQDQPYRPNPIDVGVHTLQGNVVDGRRIASLPELVEEIEAHGGHATDDPVAIDGPIVTARDLQGAHLQQFIDALIPNVRETMHGSAGPPHANV